MRGGGRVFNSGKHTRRPIDQLDDGYLEWIVKEFPDCNPWWKAAASDLTRIKPQELNVGDLVSELKHCAKKRDLLKGRGLHINAVKAGIQSNIYVEAALINLYAKCGSMEDARPVFDGIRDPDVVSWNVLILGYADNGQGFVALDMFSRMKKEGKCAPNSVTYVAALKACTLLAADVNEARKREYLEWGRQIHSEIDRHMNDHVQSTLINLYARCGSMGDARLVFDSIRKPNLVCWNVLILGYADNGKGFDALDMFTMMNEQGRCAPDSLTYVAALKACIMLAADGSEAGKRACLERGRQIHLEIDHHMSHHAQSTLIKLYASCGSMEDARPLFDSIQDPDVVSWTTLILGYADNGQGSAALDMFIRMNEQGRCAPDSVTYVAALKACTLLAADRSEAGKRDCLQRVRQIHLKIGGHMNDHAQSTLINLYSKCGSMEDARSLFDSIRDPDVLCWNVLIMGYAENGQESVGVGMFTRMKTEGKCAPDSVTYVAALKAFTLLASDASEAGKAECLERGRRIHLEIGCHMDRHLWNTLINLYAKCGSMGDARHLFDSIRDPDVVSWTAVIQGYADNGQGSVALDMFTRMKKEGKCAPDSVTYVAALKACTLLTADGSEAEKRECLETARQIHEEIGGHMDRHVCNTLINLYAKGRSMEDARRLFNSIRDPDVVSWTSLILGYADNGKGSVALDMFSRMRKEGKCAPNSVTYVAALKACTLLAADRKRECLERGRQIHLEIGCHLNDHVQSALINLYASCGSMDDARPLFDSIREPNVVCWNVLILGYAENGQGSVALDMFSRMNEDGRCAPDSVTYVAALKACSLIGALDIGRRIHSEIRRFDSHVVTSLVSFYAKCARMVEAREVFDLHPQARTVPTWSALLAGYASLGDTRSVFSTFKEMEDQGFQPNAVTFVCLLLGCSHAGLIKKGWEFLEAMPTRYGVTPDLMHYNCMIDLLGRANKLDEAVSLSKKMPFDPNVVTFNALLAACRIHGRVEHAEEAAARVMEMDPASSAPYIMLLNIYAAAGMKEKVEEVKIKMRDAGVKKQLG